jgi:integrase
MATSTSEQLSPPLLSDKQGLFPTPLFYSRSSTGTLGQLLRQLISQYQANGQLRTAETYTATLNSFMRFSRATDISLDSIAPLLMQQYESWLLHTARVTPNTSSFYMRKLRAAYNIAIGRGLTRQRYPFRNVFTGKEKTAKRAVPLSVIRTIKTLDLSAHPTLTLARDLFMFSFYTRGMAFVDMAYLTKSNLKADYIRYRRHKTGQQLTIRIETCTKEIIERYSPPSAPYLLPIITNNDNERKQYKLMQYRINYALKQISAIAGLPQTLTMYSARHSWATIAYNKNIPTSVISEALGHNSEQTTRIYLASIDVTTIDNANKLILDDI